MTEWEIERLIECLGKLALAFPQKPIPPESLVVYAEALRALPFEAVRAACERLRDTEEWFPTIAKIKRAVVEGPGGAALADEAWAEAVREAKRVGWNRPPLFANGAFQPPAVPTFSSPLIGEAAYAIGWDVICTSDKPEIVGAQFRKAFQALQEREAKRMQTGAVAVDGARLPELGGWS